MDLARIQKIISDRDKKAPESKKPNSGIISSMSDRLKSSAKSALNKAISYAANTSIGKSKIQNFARNVDPYNYATNNETSAINRIYKAGIQNIKEPARAELDEKFKKGTASTEDSVRIDLLNRYAGLPEKYGTLKKSNYTPTKGNKNDTYSSSPQIERIIKNSIPVIKTKKELEEWVKLQSTVKMDDKTKKYIPTKGQGDNYVATIPALGQGTYGIGEDEKGVYLSYYDKWDLNPFSGMHATPEISQYTGILDDSKLNKIGRFLLGNEDKNTATRNIGNAANIYGRIYFDKKTGKPKK